MLSYFYRLSILIIKPLCAPIEVERAVTKGIAKPKACGQAMTNTVTRRSNAKSTSF